AGRFARVAARPICRLTRMTMTSITEIALGDGESELATTRRFLEELPDDKLEWKPPPKSNALGRLAMHIIELVKLQGLILSVDDGFDILGPTSAPKRRLVSRRADAPAAF